MEDGAFWRGLRECLSCAEQALDLQARIEDEKLMDGLGRLALSAVNAAIEELELKEGDYETTGADSPGDLRT